MASDATPRFARSELERHLLAREQAPSAVSDVFSSVLDGMDGARAARSTWSGGRAWYAVNGDIERAHTTGVFVREPKGREQLPALIVYVDSRARATDFNANREVYQARLERVGLRFSELVFRESKRTAARPEPARGRGSFSPAEREPLPDDEVAEIERLCSQVPEGLRDSVSRAMRASWER